MVPGGTGFMAVHLTVISLAVGECVHAGGVTDLLARQDAIGAHESGDCYAIASTTTAGALVLHPGLSTSSVRKPARLVLGEATIHAQVKGLRGAPPFVIPSPNKLSRCMTSPALTASVLHEFPCSWTSQSRGYNFAHDDDRKDLNSCAHSSRAIRHVSRDSTHAGGSSARPDLSFGPISRARAQ
jgi:hypothetical protein